MTAVAQASGRGPAFGPYWGSLGPVHGQDTATSVNAIVVAPAAETLTAHTASRLTLAGRRQISPAVAADLGLLLNEFSTEGATFGPSGRDPGDRG